MATARNTRKAAAAAAGVAARQNTEIGREDLTDPEGQTEEDAIAELRGLGAAGEYKFTVSRVSGNKPGDKTGYCRTYGVGELSLDAIREEFGGGKYAIRVTEANGRYVTNRTVEIVDLPRAATAAAAAAPLPTDMQGLAAVIAAMQKPGNGQQPESMLPLLIAMMKSQTEQMIAMMNRPVPTGPSLTDLLALIQANKPADDGSVKLLLQGLELGKSLGGDGGTGMMDIAKEGLGLLGPLIQQQANQTRAVRRAPALPAPVATVTEAAEGAPARTPNPQTENAPMMQKLAWLRAQCNALVIQASRGKDPELYAEVMLDNLPPYISEDEIFERMSAEDAVAQLTMLDARVQQFADWFEAFRKAVLELLTEDEAEAGGPADMPAVGSDPVSDQ